MKKLSMVTFMVLLQRDDKQVLIIGERHVGNNCRELGFEPIDEVIRRFMARTKEPNIDLMIEMDPIGHSRTNYATAGKGDSNLFNLIAEVQTIPNENFRFHYLDAPNQASWLNELKEFAGRAQENNFEVTETWFQYYPALKKKLDATGWPADNRVESFRPIAMKLLTDVLKEDRFKACAVRSIPAEVTKKTSAVTQRARAKLGKYSKNLAAHLNQTSTPKEILPLHTLIWDSIAPDMVVSYPDGRPADPMIVLAQMLFYLQRRMLDINAFCRVMKTKTDARGPWYKNIIIYAGSSHTYLISKLLILANFTAMPIKVDFNPDCVYSREAIVDRLLELLRAELALKEKKNDVYEFNVRTLHALRRAVERYEVGEPMQAYDPLFARYSPNSYWGENFRYQGLNEDAAKLRECTHGLEAVRATALSHIDAALDMQAKGDTSELATLLAFLTHTPTAPLDPILDILPEHYQMSKLFEKLIDMNKASVAQSKRKKRKGARTQKPRDVGPFPADIKKGDTVERVKDGRVDATGVFQGYNKRGAAFLDDRTGKRVFVPVGYLRKVAEPSEAEPSETKSEAKSEAMSEASDFFEAPGVFVKEEGGRVVFNNEGVLTSYAGTFMGGNMVYRA